MHRTHVLPVLLQERNKEVDGQVDVLDELVRGHLDVTDGDGDAQHLKGHAYRVALHTTVTRPKCGLPHAVGNC